MCAPEGRAGQWWLLAAAAGLLTVACGSAAGRGGQQPPAAGPAFWSTHHYEPLNVSMFSIFHRLPWWTAVTAKRAPA